MHTDTALYAAFILQVAVTVASTGTAPCSEPSECQVNQFAQAAALVQRDHNRWRVHHDGHLRQSSCEGQKKHSCGANSICAWNQNLSRCQARIAWFHIMKCGSSFGATLAHFANSSLPRLAHMPSCTGQVADADEDRCSGNTTQGPRDFFIYKYPIHEWFPDVFWTTNTSTDPGGHRIIGDDDFKRWQGRFVGLFRSPQARVSSAYNHFVLSSNETPMLRRSNSSVRMQYLKKYAAVARGTMTKMMSGIYDVDPIQCEFHFDESIARDPNCSGLCKQCLNQDPSATALKVALARLQNFAFVGLTEYFDLSVCLFHAMFGGECRPVEFANMRKSYYLDDFPDFLKAHDIDDPYDGKLFKAASKIFWSNVALHNVTSESCSRMCPNHYANFTIHGERWTT